MTELTNEPDPLPRRTSLAQMDADLVPSPLSGPRHHPGRMRAASTGPLVVGAALIAWSSGIHLHLWTAGYRHIPWIGPLFLLQAVAGSTIAGLIAATRRLVPALLGMGFLMSSIAGLVLSASVGLLGFHDGLDAPCAVMSLVVEVLGVAFLAAGALWTVSAKVPPQ
jgi:hypothetical protein